jgi:hypothetical protein
VNENSKYGSSLASKRAGPPPGRKPQGAIDVIGGEREGGVITVSSRRTYWGVIRFFIKKCQFRSWVVEEEEESVETMEVMQVPLTLT